VVSSSSPKGKAVMILLASVSSGILEMWPNRERLGMLKTDNLLSRYTIRYDTIEEINVYRIINYPDNYPDTNMVSFPVK